MFSENHKNAPVSAVPTGAFPYFWLTCGYCRNPQLSNSFVEKCRNYSAVSSATSSTASSASAATSSSGSAAVSSVTPTRTLTVAVISR